MQFEMSLRTPNVLIGTLIINLIDFLTCSTRNLLFEIIYKCVSYKNLFSRLGNKVAYVPLEIGISSYGIHRKGHLVQRLFWDLVAETFFLGDRVVQIM